MNGNGSIRVTKTKVLQVRSEDAMDNWVSPLSGERVREGSMEDRERKNNSVQLLLTRSNSVVKQLRVRRHSLRTAGIVGTCERGQMCTYAH